MNLQKSVWEPSRVATWLGFHLDLSLIFITVPLPKITNLQESISRILAQRFVNARDLASVAGQLNSMFLAIGNIVRYCLVPCTPRFQLKIPDFLIFI